MQKKITAVIPAFNAEKTIGDIVKQCLSYCDEVFVVDDGSKDKTSQSAQDNGAKVFKLAQNYGAGFATAFGLNRVWDPEAVVTLDSDGQHDPKYIPELCKPILDKMADFVIGSRFLEESKTNMLPYRKLGITIITEAYNWGHVPITDAQCCFRAFRVRLLSKITPQSHRFGFSTEMLIRARKNGMRIREIPIECKYRGLKEDSTMNPIKQGGIGAFGYYIMAVEVTELKEELYKVARRISTDSIKSWTAVMLSVAPAAFWDKASSSTGKYHKADENGMGGQVIHTLRVCAVVDHLVRMENLPVIERDILLSAAILHDICKYGEEGITEHTLLEHPLLVDKLRQNSMALLPPCEWDTQIIDTVSQHSGRWSSEPIKNPTKLGKLLHIADFFASRHNVDVRLDK